jgi:hypothetical protein
MEQRKLNIGGVYKNTHADSFRVEMWDYKTKKSKYIGSFKTKEEACVEFIKNEFDYFIENKHLLPKGVSMNKQNRTYILQIRNPMNTKVPLIIAVSESLMQIKIARSFVIKNLIDI